MHIFFAILANIIWGLTPVYFYFVKEVAAETVILMQVVSTFVILVFFKVRSFSVKMLWQHVSTAFLLLVNWLGYFLAIQNDRGVEASLGYLMLPFFIILCGWFFFSERVSKWQLIFLLVAFFSVVFLIWSNGQFPIYGIILAISFSSYVTIHRKQRTVEPLLSLFHESFIMIPFMFLFFLLKSESIRMSMDELLNLAPLGLLVIVPLVLYLKAINYINVVLAGLIQFISPLLIMIVSIAYFKEYIGNEAIFVYGVISFSFLIVVFLSKKSKSH